MNIFPIFLPSTQAYLQKFGWTGPGGIVDGSVSSQVDLEITLKEFQNFFNLTPTGVLDEDTVELMKKPRCANPDKV